MMRKQKWIYAGMLCFFSAITVLAGGCATTEKSADVKTASQQSFAEEQALGDKMLKAFRGNDASAFIALLHKDTRARFGKKEFAENHANVKELLGEIDSFQYLTALEMPTLHPLIWKVRFCRKAKQQNEPPVYQETLFRVVFGRLDGKLYVLSFGFL